MTSCLFCRIVAHDVEAAIVHEDDVATSFLDTRPLFPGHTLVVPSVHIETLAGLPPDMLAPFFARVQAVCRAVESAMRAEGSFVAINNRVSQSVPHLHVHVVPRRTKDGLKGFFWPRTKYREPDDVEAVRVAIAQALSV